MSALDLFKQGGFIMYPLFIFSVLAWTVAVHQFLFLRNFTKQHKKLDADINSAIQSGKLDEIKYALKNAPAVLSRPHEVLLEEVYSSKEELNEKLGRRISETNSNLKKNLWILGTISSSAPFIGLFGTVMGIMSSFKAIGSTGKSGFSVVAAGISESLIATAAGIGVAVISVLFYNYFQTRVNAIAQEFRHKVEDIAELIFIVRKNGK
jgi:biopolymer transport protein ExbB/TolQ